jgi:alkanesulfonate monooxygenase SsuD/methylene tetrahydromethanopterin reductase-like flavin-dependent oxidoreductase (luciferase family)
MRVGLHVPNFTWSDDQGQLGDTFATIARRAERAGFYSLWVMDHFFQISLNGPAEHEMLEGWSALAFVAGVTNHMKRLCCKKETNLVKLGKSRTKRIHHD